MSRQDRLNWSTDLLRISWWLQNGDLSMADMFINRGTSLYPHGEKVAGREWSWWFKEIQRPEKEKAAERALTWSLLLRR